MALAKCSIIVSSCDAYRDVWEPFFILFFRYWPDCPFPIYLITNHEIYPDSRVVSIPLGADQGWATNMQKAFEHIDTPYVLYLQEDYLLQSRVDTQKIVSLLQCLIQEGASCLRLLPAPGPDRAYKGYPGIGQITGNALYRVSLQAAFWKKKDFEALLVAGESGWDMEKEGTERSRKDNRLFLSVSRGNSALDYFATAIKRGRWFYDAVQLCEKEGIRIDRKRRPIETFAEYVFRVSGARSVFYRLRSYKEKILHTYA